MMISREKNGGLDLHNFSSNYLAVFRIYPSFFVGFMLEMIFCAQLRKARGGKKIGKVCEERDNRGGERTLTPLAAFVQVTV